MNGDDHPSLPEAPNGGPSRATRAAIFAAVHSDLPPRRARSASMRALLVTLALAAACALASTSFGEVALHPARPGRDLATAMVAIGLGTLAVLAIFVLPYGRSVALWSKLALVGAMGAAWLGALVARSTGGALLHSACNGMALACAARSVAAGLLAAAAVVTIWRRADPWSPRASGAAIGVASGCVAGAGVGIACASDAGGHLLMGHGLAALLLGIAGAAAGRRLLAP